MVQKRSGSKLQQAPAPTSSKRARQQAPAEPSAAAKKKRQQQLDPVVVQTRTVMEALQTSESYPEPVIKMLTNMLEYSLGTYEDTRHKFQDGAVEMVNSVLKDIEASTQKHIEDKFADIRSLTGEEKDRRAALVNASQAEHDAEVQKLSEHKASLAEDALAFKAAKDAVVTAAADKKTSEESLLVTQGEKNTLHNAYNDLLKPLVAGSNDIDAKDLVNQLLAVLKSLGFDHSLLISIPNAFCKDVGSRGPFDTMVVTQVDEEVSKRLAALNSRLQAADSEKKERETAVEACKSQLDAARDKQLSSASVFKATQAKKKELDETLKLAQQQLKATASQTNKLNQELADLQIQIADFQAGALDAFAKLQTRSTPEVPADAPVAEEPVTEDAAPAV